ncbi:Prolyl 4-hydroxylase subunit alpha-2, partial [Pseudolycoriella hygida]
MYLRCTVFSLFFYLIVYVPNIYSELFSAIDKLEKLAANEKFLTQELEKFAIQVNDDYVFRKLKAWQNKNVGLIETQIMSHHTNPLNAFLMIKRATVDINLIKRRFTKESDALSRNIDNFLPEDNDLVGAVAGLLRLQFFYKLKTKDIASGIIDGETTTSPLSVHDLFVIGEEALKIDGQERLALEYLEIVWLRLQEGIEIDKDVSEKSLLLHLISIYRNVGNYVKAFEMLEELTSKFIEIADDRYFTFLKKSFLNKMKKSSSQASVVDPLSDHFVHDETFSDSKDRILIGKLCRGDEKKTIRETSAFFCRYLSTNSFTKLARFKIEELNLDPYIISFVDVLSENETRFLKHTSSSKQGPGTVLDANLQESISSRRIAQTSWHNKTDDKTFQKLSRRVEDMTNLSQNHAEPLQIQNYGIGGHYVGHWDCFMQWDTPFERDGNRIATVLFYLSDVEKGGATVFPFLNLRISPRKGAAIFWYNLSSSGSCDFFTRHSGCPVLLGSKWVANQWIREYGNEFKR